MFRSLFQHPYKAQLIDRRFFDEQVRGAELRAELASFDAPLARRLIHTIREIEGVHGPYFSLRELAEIETLLTRLSDVGLDEARTDCGRVAEYMVGRANLRARSTSMRMASLSPAPMAAK